MPETEYIMYQIAICDDEPEILKYLSDIIQKAFSRLNVICNYYITQDAVELLNYIKDNNADIVFLDIDMPGYSGMDIAEHMVNQSCKALLIFITQHEALVYQSFKYHPFGFIRKNYFKEEIEQVVSGAVNTLMEREDSITIRANNKLIILKLEDIIYIESASNYVLVYTNLTSYQYRKTLGELERQLSPKGFIRIHKGYLVNHRFIYSMSYQEIKLTNGSALPVGRANRDNAKVQLLKYMR
jgi:DNA-binding LytR/AlgR family response regulator